MRSEVACDPHAEHRSRIRNAWTVTPAGTRVRSSGAWWPQVSQNASTVNVLAGKSSRWLSGESMADSISPTGAQNLSPGVAPPAGVDGSAERCRRCPPPVTAGALAPDDRSAVPGQERPPKTRRRAAAMEWEADGRPTGNSSTLVPKSRNAVERIPVTYEISVEIYVVGVGFSG